ncbi:hypothetical protein [Caulobacter hibisci]|uniref:Uncharacterized protein n=1 Tax=Caulobacter hibisci TaxID=2035993 RepID=A0ABS0SWS1_9CAUL|nr:hypothetical protein [Caulobacter hibisci]MBI1684056.1 hypothetical protein [Caulobacter hibisci]
MGKLAIDYEEKLFLAIAALRGAGYAPERLVLDRPSRLGPSSIDWAPAKTGGAPRALDLDIEFQGDDAPSIAVSKDGRAFRAPVGLRPLARWLASAAGEREPLALVPAYTVARLRVVS